MRPGDYAAGLFLFVGVLYFVCGMIVAIRPKAADSLFIAAVMKTFDTGVRPARDHRLFLVIIIGRFFTLGGLFYFIIGRQA